MDEERERPEEEAPAGAGEDAPPNGRDEVDEQSEESFPASDPPSY